MGVVFSGVVSPKLRGIMVVVFLDSIPGDGLGSGEADCGKEPGISSLSCREPSLVGAVRGVRVGASWDRETRLGVDEFLPRSRAELRRAMFLRCSVV